MLLSCQNIGKSFGSTRILSNISFHIEKNEKMALIGVNGAGKSTLLKIITGELSPDEGLVTLEKGASLGYLSQHQTSVESDTIYDEVRKAKEDIFRMEMRLREMEAEMKHTKDGLTGRLANDYAALAHLFEIQNGYAAESEITGVLKGLGFSEAEFSRRIETLSGGQKMRVRLARLLLEKRDLLLLDEPTNHLDLSSVAWLESYLSSYRGAVLIVSHDRYFLDRIVTKVVEIEKGESLVFSGNYSAFSQNKAEIRKAKMHAYTKQQEEIRHQEAVIRKLKQFNREKSIRRARSREKLLERTERIEKPMEEASEMRIRLTPEIESGMDVLTIDNLSKAFPGRTLFTNQNLEIKRGERVAIIGDNGTGKTTLLRMINRLERPDTGKITFGAHVHSGYYDQEQQNLDPEKTIFDEISDTYPALTNQTIRKTLAAFLFTGDEVFQTIGTLSGGERGRVSLAKLMLSEANFLILDEPTNHLDAISRDILEDALTSYEGTVLFVSHDRYFINRTCTRILALEQQRFINYIGNYDYYLEKKNSLSLSSASSFIEETKNADSPAGKSTAALDWKAQKEEQARIRKQKNDLKKIEDTIEKIEKRNQEIDQAFFDPVIAVDPSKCAPLAKEQAENERMLEDLYLRWEKLAEAAP